MNSSFDLVGLVVWVGLLLLMFRLAWRARRRVVRILLFALGLLMLAVMIWNTFL
jgi:hypothetical protein